MDPLTILLLLGGGALLGSLFGGEGGLLGGTTPGVSGEHPKGEVLGEYPGGLITFESLTPQQKQMLGALMSYAMPKLGLPGQAFGQAPVGTTAGMGLGAQAGRGSVMPMLSNLLMGGSKGGVK